MATDIADTLHLISDINVEKKMQQRLPFVCNKVLLRKREEVRRNLQTSAHRYSTSHPPVAVRSLAFIAARAAASAAEKEVTKEEGRAILGIARSGHHLLLEVSQGEEVEMS